MKFTSRPTLYTLSVCATAAILAGCGGPSQLPNPDVQAPLNGRRTIDVIASASRTAREDSRLDSSRIELLTAEAKGHCKRSHSGLFGSCDFKATGTATGPYPGTFTASGSYYFCEVYCMWTFGESFAITSGITKISGTISEFGKGFSPTLPCFLPLHQFTRRWKSEDRGGRAGRSLPREAPRALARSLGSCLMDSRSECG